MTADSRPVPWIELRSNNGERGARKYVAFEGQVYDVTDCPKWRRELHEGLHFPGQDLSEALPEAPHGREVFARPCVRHLGPLAKQTRP